MLSKRTNSKFSYLQRITALPILAILIIALSLKTKQVLAENETLKKHFHTETTNNQLRKQETTEHETMINVSLKKKYKIVIDAGHGGADAGAKAIDGTTESEITLKLAKIIKEQNTFKDIEIVLTRADDKFMDLQDRITFCNEQNADLFMSLHCNRDSDISKSGYEIFIASDENSFKKASETFAGCLNQNLTKGNFIARYGSINQAGFFVLKSNNCPSVLIETGFITNENDIQMLKDNSKLKAMSVTILNSIGHYLLHNEK